jgi:hypothetical protein
VPGSSFSGVPITMTPGSITGCSMSSRPSVIRCSQSVPSRRTPAWLGRFYEEDLAKGLVDSPLSVSDVWPENYSTNSVQKVWAAKFAARHPNIVVLDFSSFKCGHDAPTYGLIDSIISSSATPYLALHDIDANKPGGSIKIRVKTYAHTLKLHEETLREKAARQGELERSIAAKRRELLARRREQLACREDLALLDAVYEEYLAEDVTLALPDPEHTYDSTTPTAVPLPGSWLNGGVAALNLTASRPALFETAKSGCSSCELSTQKTCACSK